MNPARIPTTLQSQLPRSQNTLLALFTYKASDNVEVTVSIQNWDEHLVLKTEAPNGFSFQVTANQLTELFNEKLLAAVFRIT